MEVTDLTFRLIDLDKHAELCVQFRADSFFCSFNSTDRFYEADGKGGERYLEWLKQRMADFPGGCVHVWKDDIIIGQIEMGRFKGDPSIGYVNLYYLAPAYRGMGLGVHLDRYTMNFFKQLGITAARLSVSPTNERAVKFYLKQGWKDLGPRPGHPEVHWMEKHFNP